MPAENATGIWVVGEHAGGVPTRVSHELLGRARALADASASELTIVLPGPRFAEERLRELVARGADRVVAVEHERLDPFQLEAYAAIVEALVRARRPAVLLGAATTAGRTLMPWLAIRLHTGLTADCTELAIDPDTGHLLQTRPAIGGHILATIRTAGHRPQMATVRPHSTQPAAPDPRRHGTVERIPPQPEWLSNRVRRIAFTPDREKQTLQDAERVVAVGRGIRRPENLGLVRKLADALDAALGATRDVVDRGWLDYPHQVGLSGKTISPRLYLAIGISGSVQHLAGMQTSDTIVAVNNDPQAPIFQVAHVGIVGDLFEVVPVLTRVLAHAPDASGNSDRPDGSDRSDRSPRAVGIPAPGGEP
ncbi:MAG: electron transfer flavoprotein subunit alpha/FixB family protein [Lentisphaeria bacterium]|nr:electron transfer flavoprotein subunit alpha/FixB family protein [Lentisphaeria bacterium]